MLSAAEADFPHHRIVVRKTFQIELLGKVEIVFPIYFCLYAVQNKNALL